MSGKMESARAARDEERLAKNREVDVESRADFLSRGAVLSLATLGVLVAPLGRAGAAERNSAAGNDEQPRVRLKGRKNSKVKRWDVITIGNLSRNRYWGESDDRGLRSAICTCTVIRGDGFRIIVDPSLKDAQAMATELDRRTGLKPGDIDAVFVTHRHGDHHFGLAHFPDAKWLAGAKVAAALNKSKRYSKRIEPAGKQLFDVIDVLHTPGHTMDHHSLRFDCDGFSVIIAGDAVATRDFWAERRGYYNAVDFDLSARTMDKMATMADIIVPGHDNCFLDLAFG